MNRRFEKEVNLLVEKFWNGQSKLFLPRVEMNDEVYEDGSYLQARDCEVRVYFKEEGRTKYDVLLKIDDANKKDYQEKLRIVKELISAFADKLRNRRFSDLQNKRQSFKAMISDVYQTQSKGVRRC